MADACISRTDISAWSVTFRNPRRQWESSARCCFNREKHRSAPCRVAYSEFQSAEPRAMVHDVLTSRRMSFHADNGLLPVRRRLRVGGRITDNGESLVVRGGCLHSAKQFQKLRAAAPTAELTTR